MSDVLLVPTGTLSREDRAAIEAQGLVVVEVPDPSVCVVIEGRGPRAARVGRPGEVRGQRTGRPVSLPGTWVPAAPEPVVDVPTVVAAGRARKRARAVAKKR